MRASRSARRRLRGRGLHGRQDEEEPDQDSGWVTIEMSSYDLQKGRLIFRCSSRHTSDRDLQAVIKVLDDPLAAAELGDTVLAAQNFQSNADLIFRREVPPRRDTDVLNAFIRRSYIRTA